MIVIDYNPSCQLASIIVIVLSAKSPAEEEEKLQANIRIVISHFDASHQTAIYNQQVIQKINIYNNLNARFFGHTGAMC